MNAAEGRGHADFIVVHAVVATMDDERRILTDGAVAVAGDRIVAVGGTAEVRRDFPGAAVVDAKGGVLTPGLTNAHIHITGEPLTKGFVPHGVGPNEVVPQWLIPLYQAHTAQEERISAQLAALEMLRTGTTCFIEAGSIKHLDAVVDGLEEIGVRGRVGPWTWDRSNAATRPTAATSAAVAQLAEALERHPNDGRRIVAWPSLVGHSACTDELFTEAKALADLAGVGMTFHMSPIPGDPAWFIERHGRRPFEHLAALGVLDGNVTVAHAVHVDDHEVALMAEHGVNIAHCPTTALKMAYGVTRIGKMPEMVAAGVNLCIGTDGSNAGNSTDLMRASYTVAGMFKDARDDASLFSPDEVFSMGTRNGARAAGVAAGALAVGNKADMVLHDVNRPEWRPLLDVMMQLVWSADGRSVHSVWVDGQRVIEDYRSTRIDEDRLYHDAQRAGESIVARTPTPGAKAAWRAALAQ